jgi:cytochrome c oxidase subunit 1
MRLQIALGGTLLFLALLAFLAVMAATWLSSRGGQLRVNSTIPEPLSGVDGSPVVLDNLRLWGVVAVLLVALAYGFPLYDIVVSGGGVFGPGSAPIPV